MISDVAVRWGTKQHKKLFVAHKMTQDIGYTEQGSISRNWTTAAAVAE